MRPYLFLFVIPIVMCRFTDFDDNYGIDNRRDNSTINRRRPRQALDLNSIIPQIKEYKGKLKISLPKVIHDIGDEFLIDATKNRNNSDAKIKNKPVEIKEEKIDPIVSTAEGLVRGNFVGKSGLKYYTFLGVRYSEKPVRFQVSMTSFGMKWPISKTAKPLKPWKGINNCTTEGEKCTQVDNIIKIIGGSEDCLHLNVITPTLEDKKLPVIVWIHGGEFRYGTSSIEVYGPERLIKKDVIVVTVNFRLGLFGFLSTGTSHAPGNAGLKDIIEALRWLKRNIHMFGGDTYNICLYGVSSGASTVEYMTLSPMAKGLFSKAIIHSGSALVHWGFSVDPLKYVYKLGKIVGIKSLDLDVLMNDLSKRNANDLLEATKQIDENEVPIGNFITFRPCAEVSLPGEEAFLSDHPVNILESGDYNHVPLMLGFNDQEGLNNLRKIPELKKILKSINNLLEYIIPSDLIKPIIIPKMKRDLIKEVKKFYFNNKPIALEETIGGFIDLLGDTLFLYSIHKSVKYRMKNNKMPIYYYEFAFDGKLFDSLNAKNVNVSGAAHADELAYVFEMPIDKTRFNSDVRVQKVSERFVTMITNFMKFGNPTPRVTDILPIKWNPIKSTVNHEYLKISDKLEMKASPNKARYDFWYRMYSNKK